MFTTTLPSPIGPIILQGDAERLLSVRLSGRSGEASTGGSDSPLLREAARQLTAWFQGRVQDFDLPLAPPSTPRGAELRAAICAIGYGKTASYGEVARRIGSGPRAIGQACRRNPFPLIVPCHRVISTQQSLDYYSAGDGVQTKQWLIDFELNN